MTPPKKRRYSRTYWVNIGVLALSAAQTYWPAMQAVLPVNSFQIVCFALPIVNLILRELTDRPVGRIKNPPPPELPIPASPEPARE